MPISEVYNCDCLEYMRSLPDKYFDLCIADPPYVALEENTRTIRTVGNKQSSLALGGRPKTEVFEEIARVSRHQIIWGANNFGFSFQGFILWEKTNIPDKFSMSQCEIASISKGLSRLSKIYRQSSASTQSEKRIHPTQKPIALYSWILDNYAKGGGKIFDPFLGSGSSRIAAYKKGYDFYACELDKDYYNAQEERFRRECFGEIKQHNATITQQMLF